MGAITAKLYDLDSNELADISDIALEKSLQRPHNGPRTFVIDSIANDPLMTAETAGDGFPNLRKGNRKLVVWEDGIELPIFHGRIHGVDRSWQGGKMTPVKITAIDPWAELGYDGEERAGRVVRGSTVAAPGAYDGNFISPKFVSSIDDGPAISGPDLIRQILTNTQGTDSEGGPNPGEGPLPIDLATGDFDLTVPPAVDLSCVDTMDWPVLCGDFIQQLVQTGVVDVDMRPVDPSEGFDPYIMVALSAVSSFGNDRSATVHFDAATGAKNAKACRHIEEFATINNKLYDYLGPRLDQSHWRANITPGSPGTTVDPTGSRDRYGTFMSIRVFDGIGNESGSRPLYIALWNAEQGYRIEPRDLLYITPSDGAKALFEALKDFDVGDLITINTGADFGIELSEAQRVYGFTKTWSRENVASVTELVTSADI